MTLEEGEIPRNGIPALAENVLGMAQMCRLDKVNSIQTITKILNMV